MPGFSPFLLTEPWVSLTIKHPGPGDPRSGSSPVPCMADHASARASVSPSVKTQNQTRRFPKVPKARNSSSRPGPAVGEQPFHWAEWESWEVLPLPHPGALFHLPQSLLLMTWLSPHGEQRGFPWWPKAHDEAPRALPGCGVRPGRELPSHSLGLVSVRSTHYPLTKRHLYTAGLQLPHFGWLSSQHQWQPRLVGLLACAGWGCGPHPTDGEAGSGR